VKGEHMKDDDSLPSGLRRESGEQSEGAMPSRASSEVAELRKMFGEDPLPVPVRTQSRTVETTAQRRNEK
jgi:hypothetical protein